MVVIQPIETAMKKLFVLSLFVIITAAASAQSMGDSYKTAVGVKFYPGAITVKGFTQENKGLEGLAYIWQYGFRFTGLYEIYGDINAAPGLKWYVGPGVHVGGWRDKWKDVYPGRENGFMFGVDGVLGLDYKINGAPINVSLDWQPSFNIVGYNYFEGGWGGIGIRYTL